MHTYTPYMNESENEAEIASWALEIKQRSGDKIT